MKYSILIVLLFPLVGLGQSNVKQTQLRYDVTFLSHDSLEGRETGTRGEQIASVYIATRFETIGLKPLPEIGGYFQAFEKKTKAHPHDTELTGKKIAGRNIIGYIDNNADYSIVIGAHYDHLGWGDESSLSEDRAIHNGADDNASGVAAMLKIAKNLKKKRLKHNIIFIAFTGEEKGLLGSNYFVNGTDISLPKISFMVNMDMVGRLDSLRRLAVHGVGTSPDFIPALNKIKRPGFQFKLDSSGMGPSDHTSFYLNEVPVVHFFTGQHAQYHKPEDDVELINFDGLLDVSQYITRLVLRLDKKEDLEFLKTRDASPDKRSFNVTLGIIPDYLFDGKGLKIDGVKDDRPADKAGLIKGDIILKIGDITVNSMEDYMTVLSTYNKGDQLSIEFLRDNELKKSEVTF